MLRIGASVGDVHFVAHDCHGIPVVEAARLENAAEPGSILVTALVRLLVGNRDDNQFEPVGRLELKGLPEPLEVFRVRWEPLADGATDGTRSPLADDRIPLPGRLQARPSVGVIGYEAELAAIERAVRRVRAPAVVGSSCSSPVSPVKARPPSQPRRRERPSTPACASSSDTVRRASRRRTSSSPKRSGTTSCTCPSNGCGPTSNGTVPSSRGGPRSRSSSAGSTGVEGHRRRQRAVPALRRGRGPALGRGARATRGPRARRPPVGGSREPPAAQPPRR